MKREKCPLCGNKKTSKGGVFRYVGLLNGMEEEMYSQYINVCPRCNMVWVANPIDVKMLDTYYKKMSKYEAVKFADKSDSSKQKMFLRQKNLLMKM